MKRKETTSARHCYAKEDDNSELKTGFSQTTPVVGGYKKKKKKSKTLQGHPSRAGRVGRGQQLKLNTPVVKKKEAKQK